VTLNLDAIGCESSPVVRTWDQWGAILYALGVGAGASDPNTFELEFTTEHSSGVTQRVLPTFATIVGENVLTLSVLGDIDASLMVHGEQTITLYEEIPAHGEVEVRTTVSDIRDKGSGALVVLESNAVDAVTRVRILSTQMGLFVRGAGGFGGRSGQGPDIDALMASETMASRPPDEAMRYLTRPDQALIYRLSGGRSPMHSDPVFAKTAGFDRPTLQGLCTYGFTGRGLLHGICGSDVTRFSSMRARFTRPAFPGDELRVLIWDVTDESPGTYCFRTENQRGEAVVDGGIFREVEGLNSRVPQ
jgi:acyl dehydratase